MTARTIRIGFIGAGSIFRTRHLPALSATPGVKFVAVANRTRESGKEIANEFGIADVMTDWRALLARKDIDAVMIGTWPYMHREMSVAALDAGKHVFCQARMAMELWDAREMLAAARAHPEFVNMVCPPPTRMPFEPFIRDVLAKNKLGTITLVELHSRSGANLNPNAVHWRERRELSGKQVMAMGIFAETLNAILGPYESLSAQTGVFIGEKKDAEGKAVAIRVPQVVTITGRLASGALAIEHHLGLAADKTTPGDQLTIYGTRGTLRYRFGDTVELAAAGEELRPVDVPASLRLEWWTESQFIDAVRNAMAGKKWKVSPDFEEAILYMKKVEAIHLSAATGRVVKLSEV